MIFWAGTATVSSGRHFYFEQQALTLNEVISLAILSVPEHIVSRYTGEPPGTAACFRLAVDYR